MAASDPFDALGDPNRRAILRLLADGERSVQAIADELPISPPAVSRHLRLLKDARLAEDTTAGTRNLYRLRDEGVVSVQQYVASVWGEAARRFVITAENPSPRRR